jgi:hypothetical protein
MKPTLAGFELTIQLGRFLVRKRLWLSQTELFESR